MNIKEREMNIKRKISIFAVLLMIAAATFVAGCESKNSEKNDVETVDQQQQQYQIAQPIPHFDFSQERSTYIQIYRARNSKVATYSVWRGYSGMIEGDCPSVGYPIPYGTQLTNPKRALNPDYHDSAVIDQAEPNGLFTSTASQATWVLCVTKVNGREVVGPIYVEDQVTTYPYPVVVNYTTNRVIPVENVMPSVVVDYNKTK